MEVQSFIPGILLESLITVMSVPDILKRKIPLWMLPGLSVPVAVQIVFFVMQGGEIGHRLIAMGLGMIPGLVLIVTGRITKKIGLADGIVLCVIGMTEGARGAVMILCGGCFILSLVSMILLAMKKVRKETCLPFIPFMGLGFLIWRLLIV